jgi:hypothetical protein
MESSQDSASQRKLFVKAAAIAAIVAVIRYFIKGWLAPLGVPTAVGSFLMSITIVLIVAMVLFFVREGRRAEGRYVVAAAWFAALVVWCQALIIAGILLTERTGKDTYYSGPWEMVHERFPTPAAHAIGHTQGMLFMIVVGLILGAAIYAVAKRGRGKAAVQAPA